MFEVRVGKQSERFLKRCEKFLFDQIVERLNELKQNPVPHKAKRVIGYEQPTFRIRIGKYRVLYRINYESKLIVVRRNSEFSSPRPPAHRLINNQGRHAAQTITNIFKQ